MVLSDDDLLAERGRDGDAVDVDEVGAVGRIGRAQAADDGPEAHEGEVEVGLLADGGDHVERAAGVVEGGLRSTASSTLFIGAETMYLPVRIRRMKS